MKTIELEYHTPIWVEGYNDCKKDVLGLIDCRIKDLEVMIEIDEPQMWQTNIINKEQAVIIVAELKRFKAKIEG